MGKFDFDNVDLKQLTNDELLKTKLSSYTMTLRTREETYNVRKKRAEKQNLEFPSADDVKAIKLLNNMLDDIKTDIKKLGGTDDDIIKAETEAKENDHMANRKKILDALAAKDSNSVDIEDKPKENFKIEYLEPHNVEPAVKTKGTEKKTVKSSTKAPKVKEADAPKMEISKEKKLFDTIPLPSKGECYENKEGKIPVSYLTAYDENLIVSPNLYDDGTFIDVLLKNKIMYEDFNPDSLLPGDRDAIVLWLRASGYGNEFPVTATDNETGKQFDTVVDLSKINYKPFTLKGDENGYFDFTLPISKDKIKFRFLTYGLVKELQKMNENNESQIKKNYFEKNTKLIEDYIAEDSSIANVTREKLNEAVDRLKAYSDSITVNESGQIIEAITNKLELSVISVNGETDKDFIKDYIRTMPARDSYALRSYITNNEPGVDFNIKVERPESLGGGSVNMFLTLDQFLFFSIVE